MRTTEWVLYQQFDAIFEAIDKADRTPVGFECRDSGNVSTTGLPQPMARITSRPQRDASENWRWAWGTHVPMHEGEADEDGLTLYSSRRYHDHVTATCNLWIRLQDTVG